VAAVRVRKEVRACLMLPDAMMRFLSTHLLLMPRRDLPAAAVLRRTPPLPDAPAAFADADALRDAAMSPDFRCFHYYALLLITLIPLPR